MSSVVLGGTLYWLLSDVKLHNKNEPTRLDGRQAGAEQRLLSDGQDCNESDDDYEMEWWKQEISAPPAANIQLANPVVPDFTPGRTDPASGWTLVSSKDWSQKAPRAQCGSGYARSRDAAITFIDRKHAALPPQEAGRVPRNTRTRGQQKVTDQNPPLIWTAPIPSDDLAFELATSRSTLTRWRRRACQGALRTSKPRLCPRQFPFTA